MFHDYLDSNKNKKNKMYQHGRRNHEKRKKPLLKFVIFLIAVAIVVWGTVYILGMLKPETTIRQASATIHKVSYNQDTKLKRFDEENFSVELPIDWEFQPRPAGPYKSYTWKTINKSKNAEIITIFEDVIPERFAVNRILILESALDQLSIKGDISENCSTYTRKDVETYTVATKAKWQGVEFLCDQGNTSRDVVGTSSKDGINTIILKSPSSNPDRKYFFSYTNDSIIGDYTTFINMINSFRMK